VTAAGRRLSACRWDRQPPAYGVDSPAAAATWTPQSGLDEVYVRRDDQSGRGS